MVKWPESNSVFFLHMVNARIKCVAASKTVDQEHNYKV